MFNDSSEFVQEYHDIPRGFFTSTDITEIASNENLKKELVSRIIPINSIYNFQRLDFLRVNEFVSKFSDELIRKRELVKDITFFSIFRQFVVASGGLLSLSPELLSVEITSSKSLLFQCKKKEMKIYLEIFFDETSGKFSEAVVNIYENKSQQLAASGAVDPLISEVSNFINQSLQIRYEYSQPPYALSRSTPAQYAF